MFVEKLTKNDLIEFYENYVLKNFKHEQRIFERNYGDKYDSKNISNIVIENGKITFDVSNLNFIATDFDFFSKTNFDIKEDSHNSGWLKFMFSKFGNDYAKAFYDFRKNKKEILLKKFENELDNRTKFYLECFNIKQNDLVK